MTRHAGRGALLWVALWISLIASLVAPPVRALDLKVGFIDSDRIFAEYPKTKEVQESFNREVQDLSKAAREKKTEIDELQRKLDQQSPMLSDAKKDEQNQLLQKKIGEYEAFVQTNWGPNGKISKLNEEYLRPIVDRVHNIVTIIGTDDGYSLILDAADGNIVFGDKQLDLTDRVLSLLRTEDESGTPTRGRSGSATGGP
jgi:outer membrane protein